MQRILSARFCWTRSRRVAKREPICSDSSATERSARAASAKGDGVRIVSPARSLAMRCRTKMACGVRTDSFVKAQPRRNEKRSRNENWPCSRRSPLGSARPFCLSRLFPAVGTQRERSSGVGEADRGSGVERLEAGESGVGRWPNSADTWRVGSGFGACACPRPSASGGSVRPGSVFCRAVYGEQFRAGQSRARNHGKPRRVDCNETIRQVMASIARDCQRPSAGEDVRTNP